MTKKYIYIKNKKKCIRTPSFSASGMLSRTMPLLLRPAQSVGRNGRMATEGAAVAAAAAADVAASCSGTDCPPSGGVDTLANESRAEVLLSLVRLGANGKG